MGSQESYMTERLSTHVSLKEDKEDLRQDFIRKKWYHRMNKWYHCQATEMVACVESVSKQVEAEMAIIYI